MRQVMLGIAVTAGLAHYKVESGHSIDVREFICANAIETKYFAPTRCYPAPEMSWIPGINATSSSLRNSKAPPFSQSTLPISAITEAFRVAGRVYLQTVMSGYNALAPSVQLAVDDAIGVLRRIPETDADRSLIWPLFVVGRMSQPCAIGPATGASAQSFVDPMMISASNTADHHSRDFINQRAFFSSRFENLGGKHIGNGATAERLMRQFWAQSDWRRRIRVDGIGGVGANWITVMGDDAPILLA
jgi:hypothetical protein